MTYRHMGNVALDHARDYSRREDRIIATQTKAGTVSSILTHSWADGDIHFAAKTWTGSDAELEQKSDWHSLILTVRGGTALTGSRVAGKFLFEGIDRPGALSFIPAGADRKSWYRNADLDYVGLFLHPRLSELLPGLEGMAGLGPRVNATDPLLAGMLIGLSAELENRTPPDRMFMQDFVTLVSNQLQRSDSRPNAPSAKGRRLNRRAILTITEFIDANLEADLTLGDLAAVVQMPADGFGRSFRATMGMAPYKYVQERRIRRAESLLSTSDMALSEVALAAGYSSQSHFTRAFRRHNGQTPGAYRHSNGAAPENSQNHPERCNTAPPKKSRIK